MTIFVELQKDRNQHKKYRKSPHELCAIFQIFESYTMSLYRELCKIYVIIFWSSSLSVKEYILMLGGLQKKW